MNVVDLFCGAGGLSLGFQKAGFQILTAIDNDPSMIETYNYNIKTSCKPISKSIQEIDINKFLDHIKMDPGELDVLIAGPPCRGFSIANRQNSSKLNPFNKLLNYYIKFIGYIKPNMFLLENVNGLKFFDNGSIFQYFLEKTKGFQYSINKFTFNCEDYGIPQRRERIIIIGTKKRTKLKLELEKRKKVSVKQAIDDLPDLENGNRKDPLNYKKNKNLSEFQKEMRKIDFSNVVNNNLVTKNQDYIIERYKYIKQGGNWKNIPKRLMKNYSNIENCHSSIYFRLINTQPSITMCNFRKNMIIHPIQDRGLSVREAARLQSFPDDFIFKGGIGSQQQQVANAVPPKLSKLLAIELLKYFNN